eukprot:6152440-Lingulodinium_polyedra.AAC.1
MTPRIGRSNAWCKWVLVGDRRMQDLPTSGFVGGKPNVPVKEGVAEDIEEAVRRAQSDEEARLTFLRLQMERA